MSKPWEDCHNESIQFLLLSVGLALVNNYYCEREKKAASVIAAWIDMTKDGGVVVCRFEKDDGEKIWVCAPLLCGDYSCRMCRTDSGLKSRLVLKNNDGQMGMFN